MRAPTDAEIDVIDGGSQTVDYGEHPNKTYEEVLAKKPQYEAYLMTEDQRGRYEEKKSINRTNRQGGENV